MMLSQPSFRKSAGGKMENEKMACSFLNTTESPFQAFKELPSTTFESGGLFYSEHIV